MVHRAVQPRLRLAVAFLCRPGGPLIRHRVVMLLVYVLLIGSAGWLLVTTPQGYIPAQDRGYVIISAQLPGAASLARTTEIVRRIENIALDTPGMTAFAVFAGLSGATRTQASNSAALFPVLTSRKCV